MTVIGAHNAMSGGKPRFAPFSKCQSKSIRELISHGIRCLDIRVYFKKGKVKFAHGLITFKSDLTIFQICSLLQEGHVRLILERDYGKDKSGKADTDRFIKLCKELESSFPKIKFFGGNRKKDWKKLYTFASGITDDDVVQCVSSMQGKWYEIIPYLYARKNNVKNLRQANEDKIYLFDFL